uniref:Uncharacterized protein n=1 Tax=Oreochromis aureus TaxID=47969 RepID=A0A668VB12_OREAU
MGVRLGLLFCKLANLVITRTAVKETDFCLMLFTERVLKRFFMYPLRALSSYPPRFFFYFLFFHVMGHTSCFLFLLGHHRVLSARVIDLPCSSSAFCLGRQCSGRGGGGRQEGEGRRNRGE